jgi:hypothetical protein
VYFGGRSETGTALGLGGSIYHLIGAERGDVIHSSSRTLAILPVLSKELRISEGDSLGDYPIRTLLSRITDVTERLEKPIEILEFLAKTLVKGYDEDPYRHAYPKDTKFVVLGTPIYIAYAKLL